MSTTVTEGLGYAARLFVQLRPWILTYAHLVVSAILPIYAGAHASLHRPVSAAKPSRRKGQDDETRLETRTEEDTKPMQGFEPLDAILYPLLAGAILTGMYYLIRYLHDPAILNNILNAYLSVFGLFGIFTLLSDSIETIMSYIFPSKYWHEGRTWVVVGDERQTIPLRMMEDGQNPSKRSPLPGSLSRLPISTGLLWWIRDLVARPAIIVEAQIWQVVTELRPSPMKLLCAQAAVIVVAYFNLVDRPWWIMNLLGFSFTYSAFQMISPTTFWTGTTVLTALFFYDIYMVFFTPMMITVATTLDIPAKLVFPRPTVEGKSQYAMLGLGDVVIPGMMMALALRFDLYLFYLKKQRLERDNYRDMKECIPDEGRITSNLKHLGSDQVLVTSCQQDTVKSHESSRGISHSEANIEKAGLNDNDRQLVFLRKMHIKETYLRVTGTWGDRFWLGRHAEGLVGGRFPKTYFHASVLGYLAGLVFTISIMHVFEHGQPALLYLVPSVVGSLWLTALVCGELGIMWKYTEDAEDARKAGLDSASVLHDGVMLNEWTAEKGQEKQDRQGKPTEQVKDHDLSETRKEPDNEKSPRTVVQEQDLGSGKPDARYDNADSPISRRILSITVSLPPPPLHQQGSETSKDKMNVIEDRTLVPEPQQ